MLAYAGSSYSGAMGYARNGSKAVFPAPKSNFCLSPETRLRSDIVGIDIATFIGRISSAATNIC
jgi:hypothetical protein